MRNDLISARVEAKSDIIVCNLVWAQRLVAQALGKVVGYYPFCLLSSTVWGDFTICLHTQIKVIAITMAPKDLKQFYISNYF